MRAIAVAPVALKQAGSAESWTALAQPPTSRSMNDLTSYGRRRPSLTAHNPNTKRKAAEMNDSQNTGANQIELDGDHDARRPDWIAQGQRAIDASVDADDTDRETHLVDVLCVLRHWAEDAGVDYESADRGAAWHYAHERLRSRDRESSNQVPYAPQFDPDQQRRALDLIEGIAWGDLELHIRSVEEALRLALEATVDGFLR